MKKTKSAKPSGKLRIGDQWNAITIIALSQNNPLKAIAEFTENSIDAHASHITIIRGREHGEQYLKIIDDGEGLPKDEEGTPNFKYVATHICDSIKRHLKKDGISGIQGEFGIGLLSFWTVGEKMRLISSGSDGRTYAMEMAKGNPDYTVSHKKLLAPIQGAELTIAPMLPGTRQLNGDKIQRYLASELRDRIRKSGVNIKVLDRIARKEYKVEPRKYSGQLIHDLATEKMETQEIYLEIYLNKPAAENKIGLYRSGTRVLDSITRLDRFQQEPWTSPYFEGLIDVPFLNLTPGTRDGIIHDEQFSTMEGALTSVEERLNEIIEQQKNAEEEHVSKHILRSVQNAFKEALLLLPQDEYDWFDIRNEGKDARRAGQQGDSGSGPMTEEDGVTPLPAAQGEGLSAEAGQKAFFEFAGPLYKVRISPGSCVIATGASRAFKMTARDRNNKTITDPLGCDWLIKEGSGKLDAREGEMVTYTAPDEPGLVKLGAVVRQGDVIREAEAIITVTSELIPKPEGKKSGEQKGLPVYTFLSAPGELWRSRYDQSNNVIIINKSHKDFIFAERSKACKLRYICRLFCKELVLANFPGMSAEHLLERMVELSLFTEEYL